MSTAPSWLSLAVAGIGVMGTHGDYRRQPAWDVAHGYDRLDPEGGIDGRVWMPPWPLPNFWVGTSIENDEYTWRADELRRAPAEIRFLSLEPLLGPLPSLDPLDRLGDRRR